MSDNDTGEKKLPGKNIQIILFVLFAVVALALVLIVKPFGTVHVEPGATQGAPAAAPAGGPPAQSGPPTR